MRIGHGYDAHRLTDGSGITLCGVKIVCEKAFIAHSDGDAAIHALIDALYGAAGDTDIGSHYPDSAPEYKDIDSTRLLRDSVDRIKKLGFEIEYADCTIIAQAPKIAPYIQKMRETLAFCMAVDVSRVNVKATTEEKMGFTGTGEGIAAHAVCLLRDNDQTEEL